MAGRAAQRLGRDLRGPGVDDAAGLRVVGKRVLPRHYIDTNDYENLGPVIRQDRELVPRVQKGLHSKGFKGSVYSEQEIRIRHFFDEYSQYMSGQKG